MKTVDGAVAFITGGGQGIGLGIARALSRAGVRLALADLDPDRLAEARSELSASMPVETFHLDVRDRTGFSRAADEAERRLGPVSLVINNAGVGSAAPLTGLSHAQWDHVLDVNLGGTINGLQTFLPRLLDRGGPGHVVNVASGAGLVPSNKFVYVTSKFAIVGLTESLSQQPELVERRIGVTVVCPGIVSTDIMINSQAQEPGGTPSLATDPDTVARNRLFSQYGLSPDVVGEQVVEGILQDRLYVHSDRMLAGPLRQRTEAILADMPAETERDRWIASVLDDEILSVINRPLSS